MRFLFGEFVIDVARRELRRGANSVQVEPQVFDLLVYLIENRDRVVTKDDLLAAVWHGRIVSESTLASRINAARHAIGDSGKQQHYIRTVVRRGLRFVGDVKEEANCAAAPESALPSPDPQLASNATPVQHVSFCKTADGVHLAVATTGEGLPVVKTANWLNHVEYDWRSPIWSPMFTRLAERFRLIRYDERGNGLSDWDVADISFEAFVRDLETVVDSLGLERFALFGVSQGAAVATAYAVRHPGRVSRLVLFGGYPLGWRKRGNPDETARRDALVTLVKHGWGQDTPAFRQVFTSMFYPEGTAEQTRWFNELQRVTTSPENAARIMNAFADIDVTGLLPAVAVPTLVLHGRHDAGVPFEQGLRFAHGIPHARFVALETRNHLVLEHEPAWRQLVDELCAFLGEDEKAGTTKATTALFKRFVPDAAVR